MVESSNKELAVEVLYSRDFDGTFGTASKRALWARVQMAWRQFWIVDRFERTVRRPTVMICHILSIV
jgi:hypothetical protein